MDEVMCDLMTKWAHHVQIGEKSIPGSGNCQCKGPGAGMD